MFEALGILPGSFWLAAVLLLGGALWALGQIRQGIGLPILAVLATIGAWYVGDVLYNDYANTHVQLFTPAVLNKAWLQVAWFLLVFLLLTPAIHGSLNQSLLYRPSQVCRLVENGGVAPLFQSRLNQLFRGVASVWLLLAAIALLRLRDQIIYYFFPYLGYVADPWAREQIGGGISALLSMAGYLQLFVAMFFGLVTALARNGAVRFLALLAVFLTWPNYLLGRTRNVMVAMALPGILAWVFVRLRTPWLIKIMALAGFFLMTNIWFAFILTNRTHGTIIGAAFRNEGTNLKESKQTRHEGLNMFEELCWISSLIDSGDYKPNYGERYFAELVNPVPRGLWPGKPFIGYDYAIARGQGFSVGDSGEMQGVTATVSTGMIGQGVVNFGTILGPAFAALLMSLWAALLARLDLRGQELGNLPLYVLGMVTTFNLGRDITFITLYTFVFGMALVWWTKRRQTPTEPMRRPPKKSGPAARRPNSQESQGAAT